MSFLVQFWDWFKYLNTGLGTFLQFWYESLPPSELQFAVFCPISLRLAPYLEPSSTTVALEWVDVEPQIGYKISDYIIQQKRMEDPSEAEVYTGAQIQIQVSDLTSTCLVMSVYLCTLQMMVLLDLQIFK